MILSLDTSLHVLSIAIVRDDGTLIGAVSMEGSGSRNEKVLPAVDFMFHENGVSRSDVKLLVGTRGPGSFTGVRIGLATLQGLSLALDAPLRAFTTHEAVAESDPLGTFMVVGDAGREEVYASEFEEGILVRGPELRPRAITSARFEVERLMHHTNIALLAACRAIRLRAAGSLDQFDDSTPSYVRMVEAEARLLQKTDG